MPFVVCVTFTVDPPQMTLFLPLMEANAAQSLRDEPGCVQFDVLTDASRPEEVFLYERYTDAQAFDAHLESPHFKTFNTATKDMIVDKVVKTYTQVTP